MTFQGPCFVSIVVGNARNDFADTSSDYLKKFTESQLFLSSINDIFCHKIVSRIFFSENICL